MNALKTPKNNTGSSVGGPYKDLHIYYLQGRLKPGRHVLHTQFIGNWEEDDFSFLFFSEPARQEIEYLLKTQPQLTYIDSYQMTYDQWQGGLFKTFRSSRFRITPSWEISQNSPEIADGELNIILDPGVVFGTGFHPTTHACLEALDLAAQSSVPESLLDLGTGTGLLAVAAARLGCPKILAVDLNLLAAKTANRNVRLNNAQENILVVQGRAEDYIAHSAEFLVANIHYEIMQHVIGSRHFLTKKRFILSGLLRSEARDLANKLARYPVKILRTWAQDGVWHTLYGKTL
jgi:ribosomal protein L11 methyltransferase